VMTPERSVLVQKIENYFDLRFREGFSGSVIFAEDGGILFGKSYGLANIHSKDSLHLNSAFQLASVSKPITALAVLILKEQGLLSLDDTLRQFIPDFPYPGVTIRMLLCHRSGLPNYMYLADEVWPDKEVPLSNDDMIDLLAVYKPKSYYPPNTRYNYSNTNYALLATIVERVSGVKFQDFVQKRIFNPIRMTNSSIYSKCDHPANPNPVTGYVSSRREAENSYLNGVVGDKGVYASAIDLLRLDQALYNNMPVSAATLDEAFTSHHKDLRLHDNYGLGWRLDVSDTANAVIYHSGWWKGFKTQFVRETGTRRTIIVLSNTLRGSNFKHRELRELFTF